jgi:hypothetical protein
MGTTSEQRYFLLKNLDFDREGAELIVKCAISRNDTKPQKMVVSADDKEIKTITLTANDSFPRFEIPVGTKQVKIASVKGNRISMHQIFVVRGDYKVTETSIDGFPLTLAANEYLVKTPFDKDDVLYFRVTPKGLRPTNTVKVVGNGLVPDKPIEAIDNMQSSKSNVRKVFENGVVIIVRDGVKYNMMGQRL